MSGEPTTARLTLPDFCTARSVRSSSPSANTMRWGARRAAMNTGRMKRPVWVTKRSSDSR